MARQHEEPQAPRGPGTEHLNKHRSTDPEQDGLGPSPAMPNRRPWASASYDPDSGRSVRVGQSGPDSFRQVPSAGTHTQAPTPHRSRRLGRW
jgi:hypothetical protein